MLEYAPIFPFFSPLSSLFIVKRVYTTMNPELLKNTFKVDKIDPDGRVYMRVSRAVCTSDDGKVTLTTDFNREEYQLLMGDRITICLASTLDREGHKGSPVYDHSLYHRDSLLSDYEYAMHGRVYECSPNDGEVDVLASFGGLLMKVSGPLSALRELRLDTDVFLLIKKHK